MGDVQEELQKLTKIRDLQHKVVVLRKEVPLVYDSILKKQLAISTQKLMNGDVQFEKPKLYIPEMEELDMNTVKIQPRMNIDEIYKHAEDIEKCFKYISRDQQLS